MDFMTYVMPHIYNLGFLMIWLIGIVYAFISWRKHPWTSLLAASGLGILAVMSLLSSSVTLYIQYQYFYHNLPMQEYTKIQNVLSVCIVPFTIVGRLLTVGAIFWRKDIPGRELPRGNLAA